MTNNKTIFVTGGTGNQGGAVAKNLIQQGFSVKVLTRNINATKAQSLKNLNVELVTGDLNDVDSYRQYLKDIFGVFSVQTFENGIKEEINQGKNFATVAKDAGKAFFIFFCNGG